MKAFDNVSGYLHSWSYLFIIEGGITVFMGIVAYFITPDIPSRAKFINDEERKVFIMSGYLL